MMKFNKWTVGLATAGVVSLGSVVMADESPISTLVSGTTIGGAVDTSAQWKPSSGSTMANRFANTTPDHYNGFNLEYVELRIEKPLDEGQWSAGYKAELWFGQDAGWLPGALGGGNLAVKQAYVTMRAPLGNGLDFKIGQVDSLIGYESLSVYKNPNFSRSLGSFIEPWSQTGIVASYQATEWFGLSGSVANSANVAALPAPGAMNWKQTAASQAGFGKGNGLLTYSGAVTFKAPESWGWLAGSALYGGIVDRLVTNQRNTFNYYAGLSLPTPIKEVTLGFAYDFADRVADMGANQNTYAQAVSGYITYQITEKLRLNTRAEFANASSTAGGVWLTPTAPWSSNEVDGYNIGSRERLFALTGTLEYQLWDNVVSRLEALWDHNLIGTGSTGPFNGNNNSVLLMANIAYKF